MYIESNVKCIKIFYFSIVDNPVFVVVVVVVAVDKDMVLKVPKKSMNKGIGRAMIYVWVRKTNH
jgi:hypothetical protein